MPRAYHQSDFPEATREPGAGEWQALRGELVALLDKVESRYAPEDMQVAEPAISGLSRRMQQLRQQVEAPESNLRRREALRTVKRAVDRFSERDASIEEDDLTSAINEIRSRQGAQPQTASLPMRRATDMPEIRELGSLVGGMTQRLERLEEELKLQRSTGGNVREVASQVEQLTQVVELLAGAVGETGQVKRLEGQISALATMIEQAPKTDLRAINARLDDVSATVGKLAELQAKQMEREILRDQRANTASDQQTARLAPAMESIEASVRSVYDRIDAIERSVAMSSGDFEQLTAEMAAFTKAMKDNAASPDALVERVEALASRLENNDSGNAEVRALRGDLEGLRAAVIEGIEPRFMRIEGKIEELSERIVPVDTSAVESQLSQLLARMDDASAQLDGLAQMYQAGGEKPDYDALANLVAERTSEAVAQKTSVPVAGLGVDSLRETEDRLAGLIKSSGQTPDFDTLATLVAKRTSEAMALKTGTPAGNFDPESLRGIEEQLAGLVRSSGQTPDYDTLAELVATRTSEAVAARSATPAEGQDMDALEQRMTAIFNTAGKDTAERLARLEAILASRNEEPVSAQPPVAQTAPVLTAPMDEDPFEEVLRARKKPDAAALDTILANLSRGPSDAMPANPADEKPLIDRGPGADAVMRSPAPRIPLPPVEAPDPVDEPRFDPEMVQRPPRPQSSFASQDASPFVEAPKPAAAAPEPVATSTSTSTFVAAARRAQRARQEDAPPAASGSLIGRALSRVRQNKTTKPETGLDAMPVAPVEAPAAEKPVREKRVKPVREKREKKVAAEVAAPGARLGDDVVASQSFLTRNRRPLLLAATLVAVSLLALNLVLQRMEPAEPAAPASAEVVPEAVEPAPAETAPVGEVPAPEAIDTTPTGSINRAEPIQVSQAEIVAPVTPLPPALATQGTEIRLASAAPAPVAAEIAPMEQVALRNTLAPIEPAAEPVALDLPPEAVGPLELREAAAAGDAKAQFEVAAILGEGKALSQDLEASAQWYQRSAEQGFVPAQYRLGNLYELGSGVEQDYEQALLWYERSAEAGNRMAMHNLAALHAGGQMGEQDFETAAKWFTKAANLGMTDSQFNLGMLYARGLGVEQDFEQSFKWFSIAATRGDKDATQARDDIAKSLSAEAVGRVDDELKAWTVEKLDFAVNFAPIGTWSESFDPGETIGTRDVVLRVQEALNRLGFELGTADGVAGPKTADAIRTFERSTGMSESGAVNPRLLAVLGSQPV